MARRVTVEGIRTGDVVDAVGRATADRGRVYASDGSVLFLEWHDETLELEALVRGSGNTIYTTSVFFEPDGVGDLELLDGLCSCPVGQLCKHVAAAALAAVGDGARRRASGATVPSWEKDLDALLGRSSGTAWGRVPLALELAADGSGSLAARLLRPGKKGWVKGNLTWHVASTPDVDREYRAEHLAVVRELHALHRAADELRRPYAYYAYYGYGGDQRTIDLAAITSPRLWPLLDEAAEVGLELRQARQGLGPLDRYRHAELSLDVTAAPATGPIDGEALTVRPVLRFAGDDGPDLDARPVAFLGGEPAHGVVHVSAAEGLAPASSRLRLARLDAPVPPAVQHAALMAQAVTVPADQLDRFRERFGARLARTRAVISSDGTYEVPRIAAPVLVLRTTFGADHVLDLDWEWSYAVGDTDTRARAVGAHSDGAEFRDAAAEREVLGALDEVTIDWERFGLRERGEARSAAPVSAARLTGLDTAAFTAEALPVLEATDALRVERSGEPAAYREVGDEVRIAVSTTESDAGTDWFDLGVTITVEGREVPFTDVFTALARGETHLLLPDGAYFPLEKPELVALRTLIEEARAMQDRPGEETIRLTRFQAGWWEELAALGVVERQAAAWRQQVGGLLAAGALDPAPVPPSLQAELRPYQREGFEWLAFLWRHRLGGVLADDMGLGKTVQALAVIAHARATEPGAGPVLIVAPTSVVANWKREAARFTPELRVATLTDTLRTRGEDLETAIGGADVVVTSYTLFRLDVEAHERVAWSGVLFDEAQFLKNRQSKVYQCARRVPSPFKLAITGTPMENDLMELWSLLSITAPGLFASPERFRETYARPVEKGDTELLARLRRRIRPLMMRRTKEQVAPELPPKQEQVLPVELGPGHHRLYQRVLQRERQKILKLLDDVDGNRISILASITRLRQLSLHPALVGEDAAGGSAKIDLLVEQLRDVVGSGHRALVFSQFTGFLAHVRDGLDAAGIAHAYLDGTSRDREASIAAFKEGAVPVFVISLKAGGFGLNLTEADYCFMLDPWWNPAAETQAIDRTHRIGQERTVMVYRLIAQDTIEEKVRTLAQRKAALTAGVMDDGAAFTGALEADDIRALVA